jgi:hypothetical protein
MVSKQSVANCRAGLTLAELLIATTIMLLIAGAVGTLAATVHSTNTFCQGYVVSAQHARVALSRIERTVTAATASEQFPGCLVVSEQSASQTLPSTLVVWSPTGTVANPSGLPLISEIAVYGPDPAHPNQLVEVRSPTETNSVPAATDTSGWRTLTARLLGSSTLTKVVLTDRLRTTPITGSWSDTLRAVDLRGAIRFRRLMAPTDSEWTQYRAGTRTWQNINWPLDRYGSSSGTRTVACQIELQMAPGPAASAAATSLPFFGSALVRYQLPK